jgi:hypothetical protein
MYRGYFAVIGLINTSIRFIFEQPKGAHTQKTSKNREAINTLPTNFVTIYFKNKSK